MFAKPNTPATMTIIFTAMAKKIFCQAIDKVRSAILKERHTESRLEFMYTTSAASMAESAPLPIAPPTSAPVNTGASLMPSPTNITEPWSLRRDCTTSNLSCGNNSARTP